MSGVFHPKSGRHFKDNEAVKKFLKGTEKAKDPKQITESKKSNKLEIEEVKDNG